MSIAVIGVLCAIGAFFAWWIGDFLIQRSTRKIGNRETILVITLSATIFLFPFVYRDLHVVFLPANIWILSCMAVTFFVMALVNSEALKRGKISVVEPIFTLEVPVVILLSYFFLNESLSWVSLWLIFVLLLWLILVSAQSHHFSKRAWLEKWVLLAILGAFLGGMSNFLVGFSARINNPLLTIWCMSIVSVVFTLIYLLRKHSVKALWAEITANKKLLSWLAITDNAWWIFFAFAMTLVPIAVAVSLSEWYIALACVLGLIINKEKITKYQQIGLLMVIVCAVVLAFLTSG